MSIGIHSLRILPPFAIGRLGSADEPMDNYEAEVLDPVGFRTLKPAPTLRVQPETGEIVEEFSPETVRFRDAVGRIRPICPFFELWVQREAEGDLEPLTAELLRAHGIEATQIEWRVQVSNIKAYRRTDHTDDKIDADTGWFSDHSRRPLEGHCPNFLPNKSLPLGTVQFLKPTEQFPEIRLRFSAAGGYVYGPIRKNNIHDPNLKDVVYDRNKGTWAGYSEPDSNPPPATTNPGQVYYGERPPATPDIFVSLGYLDDECDGFIEARLKASDGSPVLSAFARIAVGPPTFAPDSFPIRTVADELEQALFGPHVEEPATREEVEEIVRRSLDSIRLMNTQYTNSGSLQRGYSGMARMDSLDTNRAVEPIMNPAIVDNLALRARHERVLLGLESGTLAWFSYILRRYNEVGDLTDDGRRKMPAMMRGADGRHLALTRRQVSKVKSVASASGARRHAAAITVQDLRPLQAEKTGEEA